MRECLEDGAQSQSNDTQARFKQSQTLWQTTPVGTISSVQSKCSNETLNVSLDYCDRLQHIEQRYDHEQHFRNEQLDGRLWNYQAQAHWI